MPLCTAAAEALSTSLAVASLELPADSTSLIVAAKACSASDTRHQFAPVASCPQVEGMKRWNARLRFLLGGITL